MRTAGVKRTLLPVCAFLLLLLLPRPASALVNIERMRWQSDKNGPSLMLDLGLNLKRGNTVVTDLSSSGTAGYRAGRNLTFLIGNVDYGAKSGVRYLNSSMLHLRYNRLIGGPWALEAFTQIQQDEFRLLLDRRLAGGGVRWATGRDTPLRLAYGLSTFLEREHYDLPSGSPDQRKEAVRLSGYGVVYADISSTATVDLVAYIQPKVNDWSNLRGSAESSLEVAISDALTLGVSLNLNYDSNPVGDVKTYDLSLKNKLSIAF